MIKALSRKFKNSGEDSRQVRRAEARRFENERDGRRDDWRDERQEADLETASEDRLVEDEFEERRHASASRRRDRRREREPEFDSQPPRWRDQPRRPEPKIDPDEIAESAAALVTRRVAASERHTARALENIAEMIETTQRRFDPGAIDDAVASFERRAAQNERRTAEALENIADLIENSAQKRPKETETLDVLVERLGRIESKIAAQPEQGNSRPIRSALARLESRIDRLSNDGRGTDFEEAISGLDKRLAAIASRLDADAREREAKPASAGSEPAERGPTPQEPPRAAVDPAPLGAAARHKRPLADAIAEIASRQSELDAADAPAAPPKKDVEEAPSPDPRLAIERLENLHAAVDAVARRLEALQSGEGDRADQQLVLMRQVDSLRRQIEESARGETPAIAHRFDQLGKTVALVSDQIEGLSRKEHPAIVRRFDRLGETIDSLSRHLQDFSTREDSSAERRFRELGEQVETLSRQVESALQSDQPANARRFSQLAGLIESLGDQISATAQYDHPAHTRRFAGLSEQVDELSRRVEDALRVEHPATAERFGRLGEQFERLSRQIDQNAHKENPEAARRFDQLGDSVHSLSREIAGVHQEISQNADRQERISKDVERLREEIESLSGALRDLAPRASTTAIESAVHELLHRIDAQRDRGVGEAALAPVERLAGELRAVMKDLDPSPLVGNLSADVRAIAQRLENMPSASPADAATLGQLSRQTLEIKELLGALASRPLPLEKLETRLFDLTQRVDGLSIAAGRGSGKEIDEVVKAIRSIVAAETGNSLNAFNHRLEKLSGKLEEVAAKSGAKRFDQIDARIETMHKSLAQRIDRGMAQQQTANAASLESLVASLAKKIDSALDNKNHNPAFEELGRKIEKLEARIQDPAAAQSIARIERLLSGPDHEGHFKELAHRIDNIGKTLTTRYEQDGFAHSAVDLSHIEDLVRRLGDRIDAALEPEAGRRDIEQLEHQVEQLSQKLDKIGDISSARGEGSVYDALPLSQFEEISDRIDFMHNALAARIEAGARSREDINRAQMADLVEQVTRKVNSALEPNADAAVLLSLEGQIKELSQRLDRKDGNGAALASIEGKIAELFSRIEETRIGATDAAEAAVRRATLEVLREASNMAGALNPAARKEIEDIRRVQDEAGARTHETLSAVHETLERVVDRLAIFEDELTEIRSAPQLRSPAPEAARPREAARGSGAGEARSSYQKRITEPSFDALERPIEQPSMRRGRDVEDVDFDSLRQDSAPFAPRGESTQSAFIAAARRAAQQVASEASAEEAARRKAPRQSKPVEAENEKSAVLAGVGATLAARKRPILLGLTALVMLVGAYQMAHHVKLATKHGETGDARSIGETGGTAELAAPQPQIAPSEPAPAAEPQKANPAAAAGSSIPQLASPNSTPAGTAASSPLGLAPIGPFPSGPAMAPHPAAKPAAGVDTAPVGAISHSPQETAAAIKALAATGDAAAQYELGSRYADGRGLPRDNKAAAEWFQKAAEQGLAPAQYRLGSYYEKGIGVERDYTRARKLYEQAAEAGNARAMHNLAVLAAEGNDGKPDYGVASDWFRRAAELGVRDSQYNLAILYARGLGVGQSMTQSYLWFSAAAQQGDADAAKKRDEVASRLDSKELAAAKALVDGFKPRQPKREANDVAPPRAGWESLKAPDLPPVPKSSSIKPKMSQL
ncbi:SEL1-like repeat protein [Methylocystis heyeri]|uniref:Peptidoglycan-binding protein n=1 Tax=Methylocystis heyeri TaxID=391905 RepID=A0A6B8KJ33_9HYPH|nr:SEL1-like repeat protein [Methylocystis heyeri]QGM47692.1 hypothetical protein H2LOC_019555 [Methylocystis heyeri]